MTQAGKQGVALITGAARRIGASIAKYVHAQGMRVVVHYWQSAEEAQALVAECNRQRANSALAIAADLADPKALSDLLRATVEWGGRLDLLVHNASVFIRTDDVPDAMSLWDPIFTVNVKAPWQLSEMAFPYLAENKGSIVYISDMHADSTLKGYGIYIQSKAALHAQTRILAKRFAPAIRVNAVAPGAILWPEGDNHLSEAVRQQIREETALKIQGAPEDIAQAVWFLHTQRFVTAQILAVNGGRGL
ncbi:MAG: pteridine reductase [Legionellaceae bacterium]|nr:pteridine reductase [Legionellaceae bacterium]